jgi:sporulation protein YlmC with PRC-barrel domain
MTMAAPSDETTVQRLRLSELAGRPVVAHDGQRLGKVKDVIVRLDLEPGHHPPVTGMVVAVDRRNLFVPLSLVNDLANDQLRLSTARLDLRPFERRDAEVLLKEDLLGHRLIDVANAQLVRARDVELDGASTDSYAGPLNVADAATGPSSNHSSVMTPAPSYAPRSRVFASSDPLRSQT